MDIINYHTEARVEHHHWWFVVRRKLFHRFLEKLNIKKDDAILDIGISTGATLDSLRNLGYQNLHGLDSSDTAISYCKNKGLEGAQKGSVCDMPFAADGYQLVLATDILEHVDDDAQALREIARVLKPGGYALITVPAFQSLWGHHDEIAHHKRRYTLAELNKKIDETELKCLRNFYFNYLLFLPIWLVRKIIRMVQKKPTMNEASLNAPIINFILKIIFSIDTYTAPIIKPMFGVSAFVLVQKPKKK